MHRSSRSGAFSMAFFQGLLILAHAAVETLRISLPTVWESRQGGPSPERCDARLRSWSQRLLQRVDSEVRLEGIEHLEGQTGPYVLVSNHQSLYDIPALLVALPFSVRMAAKQELFSIPIWGRALLAAGFVPIDRSSPERAYAALHDAGEKMRAESMSLYIAPEGTRSSGGTLGPFKKGAFDLARTTSLAILPLAIFGTREIHATGSREVHIGRKVTVRILPPIPPTLIDDLSKAAEMTREYIQAELRIFPE